MQTARIISGECVQIGQTSTETHKLFSRRMTWKRTGHEHRTINSHPASAAGHPPPVTGMHAPTGPASDPEPLHPPAPDVRGMDQHGAWGRGDTCRRGCLRTAHRPGLHAGGRVEDRDHGSARGRAGMSPGRLAGWLLMVEHSCVVCAAGASPLHPPSTQTRRSGELHTSPDGT